MGKIAPARGGAQDHRAHGVEAGDRIISHNPGSMGEAVTPDVGHKLAMAGSR